MEHKSKKLVKQHKLVLIWAKIKMANLCYTLREKVEICFITKEFYHRLETNLFMQFKRFKTDQNFVYYYESPESTIEGQNKN
jgi:hypothetical protein